MKITSTYIYNILKSDEGLHFLNLLYDENNKEVRENLKYSKVFEEERTNLDHWDKPAKRTIAKFIYTEYTEGNLKIPQTLLYAFDNCNISEKEWEDYYRMEDYIREALESEHGPEFERLILADNNMKFNERVLEDKGVALKLDIPFPDLFAEYLRDSLLNGTLVSSETTRSFIEEHFISKL